MTSWHGSPVIGVRDVRAAAEYYRDVLGFNCPPERIHAPEGEDGQAVYAIVDRNGLELHLQIRRRDVHAGGRPTFEGDVYAYVDNAQKLYEEFERSGAAFARRIEASSYGLRDFVVEDLDGNRIAFGSDR